MAVETEHDDGAGSGDDVELGGTLSMLELETTPKPTGGASIGENSESIATATTATATISTMKAESLQDEGSTSFDESCGERAESKLPRVSNASKPGAGMKRKKKTIDEKKIIYGAIKTNPLFSEFTRDERIKLVDAFRPEFAPKSSIVIRQGGVCDRFYVLEQGKVRVVEDSVGQCTLNAVIAFGEMSLQPSAVSVQAICNCKMWVLDQRTFQEARDRKMMQFLKGVKVHGKSMGELLKPEELKSMASATSIRKFYAGDTIIRQGQKGDAFYVVKDGTVGVSVKERGANKAVETLGSGSFFGEKALSSACVMDATCTALTDVTCAVITREDFVATLGHQSSVFDEDFIRQLEAHEAIHETFLEKEPEPDTEPIRRQWSLGRRGSNSSTSSMLEKDRMLLDQKVEFLKKVNIHGKVLEKILKPSELESMALAVTTKKFKAGDTVVLQWDKGDAFYVIEEGKVDVFIKEKGDKAVTRLESGSFFGERAMLSTVVNVATCKAATDVKCLVLMREDFMEMLGNKKIFEKSFSGRSEAMQSWQESFLHILMKVVLTLGECQNGWSQ